MRKPKKRAGPLMLSKARGYAQGGEVKKTPQNFNPRGKTFDTMYPIQPRTPEQVEKDKANAEDRKMAS